MLTSVGFRGVGCACEIPPRLEMDLAVVWGLSTNASLFVAFLPRCLIMPFWHIKTLVLPLLATPVSFFKLISNRTQFVRMRAKHSYVSTLHIQFSKLVTLRSQFVRHALWCD